MQILKLKPTLKQYVWGGTKLSTQWGKGEYGQKIAESWELSLHSEGKSVIGSGDFLGKELYEVIAQNPEYISQTRRFDTFPLMIKLIDAQQKLSVQVHPDDSYAQKYENSLGKTEMWYVVDADADAGIYLGFKKDVDMTGVRHLIAQNTIESALNFVPVLPGQSFLINAGTVHAIGAGVTICEIQQNSNTTYRVYDYDRKDASGNTRPLHIEKTLAVMDLDAYTPANKHAADGMLVSCRYFTVHKHVFDGDLTLNCSKESFVAVCITKGNGKIQGQEFKKGDTFFVPAGYGKFTLCGKGEIITATI